MEAPWSRIEGRPHGHEARDRDGELLGLEGRVEAAGARCWFVAPTLGGRADSGAWRTGLPAAGLGGVTIVAVGEAAMIDPLAEQLLEQLRDNAAVVLLSDVEVLRPTHF